VWTPITGAGSTADPLVLCFPKYDAGVEELVAALFAVNAEAGFGWMSWDGPRRYPGGAGLAGAPVADPMRLIAVVVSG
jgi:hypothetical protein